MSDAQWAMKVLPGAALDYFLTLIDTDLYFCILIFDLPLPSPSRLKPTVVMTLNP